MTLPTLVLLLAGGYLGGRWRTARAENAGLVAEVAAPKRRLASRPAGQPRGIRGQRRGRVRSVKRTPPAAARSGKSVGFPPIACADARVLVLGSLPGRMSLERQQYYAQPRNAFWRIVEALWGIPLALPYEERTRRLALERVALWDVCAAAVRAGSLDTAIVHHTVEPNDFASFLTRHPRIRGVYFNGTKSAELWLRLVAPCLPADLRTLPTQVLPSTSPAHQVLTFAAKLERWRVVHTAARR